MPQIIYTARSDKNNTEEVARILSRMGTVHSYAALLDWIAHKEFNYKYECGMCRFVSREEANDNNDSL
jgi:hypothetical protein